MKKYMISFISMILIIIFTFNTALAFVFFYDVYGHWAEDSIMWGANLNFFNGYEDETFRPDESISRSEYIAILNRIAKKQGIIIENKWAINLGYDNEVENADDISNYVDLVDTFWGYKDIKEVAAYINGRQGEIDFSDIFPGNNFKPNKDITREEAAVLTYIFVSPAVEKKNTNFTDIDDDYKYKEQIYELTNNGIIQGYPDNTFKPQDNIKRGEAATIIKRVYDDMGYSNTVHLSGIQLLETTESNLYPYFGEYNTVETDKDNRLYKRAIETLEYKDIMGTIPYEERHLYDSNPVETLMNLKEQEYWNIIGTNYYLIKNDKTNNLDKNQLAQEMVNSYIDGAKISDYETMLMFNEAINLREDQELILNGLNKWYNETVVDTYKYNALFTISKLYAYEGQFDEALKLYDLEMEQPKLDTQKIFYLNKAYIHLLDNKLNDAEGTLREGWSQTKTNAEYTKNKNNIDRQFTGALKEILIQKQIYADN